jgi:hypothetical protein
MKELEGQLATMKDAINESNVLIVNVNVICLYETFFNPICKIPNGLYR